MSKKKKIIIGIVVGTLAVILIVGGVFFSECAR